MRKVFCAYCNKPILVSPSGKSGSSVIIKSYTHSFCSISCRSKYYDEQSSAKK